MRSLLSRLQPLGRALMLPIAVLPVAGLLLRLGQPDLLNIPFIASAGDAIFSNLGLLFALGVAIGLAKDNHGAAGLAGAVCFLVATAGAKSLIHLTPDILKTFPQGAEDLAASAFKDQALAKLSVPMGLISGVVAGDFYNRYGALKLPEFLAFFGGRRFVPILSGVAGLGLSLVFGFGWTFVSHAMDTLSRTIGQAGPFGLFAYGFLNRILIVTGLHHILNNVVWFLVGDYHGVTGDLHRFFAGDPTAGAFMSGFFPVMMFGLPAACLAIYHTARPDRRKEVGGMLLSLALTAFLTGVTEPIEFTFMFLAPALYGVHAVLTGIAMVVMDSLHVRLGFGFSAGLFDYVLNFRKATRPWLLLPVGMVYAALYYGIFRVVIVAMNLKTPGREDAAVTPKASRPLMGPLATARGEGFVQALGGKDNLLEIGACTTRLRMQVRSRRRVDEAALKALGSKGVVWLPPDGLQVVLGPIADQVAREIGAYWSVAVSSSDLATIDTPSVSDVDGWEGTAASTPGRSDTRPAAPTAQAILTALGGQGNIKSVDRRASRLIVDLGSSRLVDDQALKALGVRGVVKPTATSVQIILGPKSLEVADALRGLLLPA